jgi:hypothetical protein
MQTNSASIVVKRVSSLYRSMGRCNAGLLADVLAKLRCCVAPATDGAETKNKDDERCEGADEVRGFREGTAASASSG